MRRAALAVLIAVFAAACGSDAPGGDRGSIKESSRRLEADVTVVVRGAETIRHEGRTTILIYQTVDARVPLGLRLFSVGMPPPHVPYKEGSSFRAAFDVLGFKGDGPYEIPKTIIGSPVPGPSGLSLPSGIQSNAFVEILTLAAEPPVHRYDVALEPCRVLSERDSLRGTVSCPKLQSERGSATVSLEMAWDAGGSSPQSQK